MIFFFFFFSSSCDWIPELKVGWTSLVVISFWWVKKHFITWQFILPFIFLVPSHVIQAHVLLIPPFFPSTVFLVTISWIVWIEEIQIKFCFGAGSFPVDWNNVYSYFLMSDQCSSYYMSLGQIILFCKITQVPHGGSYGS